MLLGAFWQETRSSAGSERVGWRAAAGWVRVWGSGGLLN